MAKHKKTALAIWLVCLVLAACGRAQVHHVEVGELTDNVIMPQTGCGLFRCDRRRTIEVTKVAALADILETTAVTTIEIHLRNTTGRRQEAELDFAVPAGAVVKGFAYDGPGGEITARVLPKDEARKIYRRLVAKIRDPALVEFIGYNLIRSSVFPIEARSQTKVRLTYEHLLAVDRNRVDYVLPRSESIQYNLPWEIEVRIRSKRPISTIYSPTHELEATRSIDPKSMKSADGPVVVTAKTKGATTEPGPFRLSYLLQQGEVTASMFAYPDAKIGGGYFLLLAGLPAKLPEDAAQNAIRRELTLVIDRSGSMRNEKIRQAKEAALQVIAGLKEGEKFNVCIYNDTVQWFSPNPVAKTDQTEESARKYIEGITASGGTNLYQALKQALQQQPTDEFLPVILFLTDGLPTVGNTSEIAIRQLATRANPHNRRVFTFGVGLNVNAPLLEKIAQSSRARAEFVLPKENVEAKVGRVFESLSGPVLADLELKVVDEKGRPAHGRTRDILPDKLPDMFEGDQLVLLGQYVDNTPVNFEITGNYLGRKRTFRFTFDFDNATVRNGFVPRLWASRKIAVLIDEIRQMGADPGASCNDPKAKELVDEIVRLSTQFGILTEYTAFLAEESTTLDRAETLRKSAGRNLTDRAMRTRSGPAGVNQSLNFARQNEPTLNITNSFVSAEMRRVSIANVQQINDLAYYRRGTRWIDSRLAKEESRIKPARIIEFGSDEFLELADKLARENRQAGLALSGDILLMVDGEPVLVRNRN